VPAQKAYEHFLFFILCPTRLFASAASRTCLQMNWLGIHARAATVDENVDTHGLNTAALMRQRGRTQSTAPKNANSPVRHGEPHYNSPMRLCAEQRRAEQRRKMKFPIRCAACGQLFLSKRGAATCSQRCGQRIYRQLHRVRRPDLLQMTVRPDRLWLGASPDPTVKLLTLPVRCTRGNRAFSEECGRIARRAFAKSEPTSTTWTKADRRTRPFPRIGPATRAALRGPTLHALSVAKIEGKRKTPIVN
jgi:hypothetical protein